MGRFHIFHSSSAMCLHHWREVVGDFMGWLQELRPPLPLLDEDSISKSWYGLHLILSPEPRCLHDVAQCHRPPHHSHRRGMGESPHHLLDLPHCPLCSAIGLRPSCPRFVVCRMPLLASHDCIFLLMISLSLSVCIVCTGNPSAVSWG